MCVFPLARQLLYKDKKMGKNNIHILIERFFGNDLSPEIQKKFHAWLLDRKFQEEKEKTMGTLWEEASAEADASTFRELSRLHKRIEASGQTFHKPIGLYIRRIAAILLLPLLGAFGAYYYLTKVNPVVEEAQLKECFAANGEQKQVELPDGTKVWLNSGSLLVYDKQFKGKRRLLFLNGEARFQVAKDPTKPFLVKTAHMTVNALGTVFNLNAYADQDVTIATLGEGKIRVEPGLKNDTSLILSPDEQITYNHRLGTFTLHTVNAERVMKWTDGYLIFQAASFDQIIKTIERKFDVTVNYETERFAGKSFTMKFNPNEGLEQVLEVMKEMIKGLKYKIKEKKVYIN